MAGPPMSDDETETQVLGRTLHPMLATDAAFKGARVVWFLSVVYAFVALAVSVLSYQHTGPAGRFGDLAMDVVRHVAGGAKIRDWASGEAERTATYLKGQISGIEMAYPERVEAMHQVIPITQHNVHGPSADKRCLELQADRCFDTREGCAECPFDRSTPDGRRCCGEQVNGSEPLPNFGLLTYKLGAEEDLLKHGGSTHFSNVVFRVRGSGAFADGSAILASAHYDSVAGVHTRYAEGQDPALPSNHGPGVADDLSAVAVLLEAARKLASQPPLPRDVIFAFVNGEEVGCMGSTLFRQLHQWRHRPAVLINLEGRGKASSKEWLLRSNSPYAASAYARFAPSPGGFSILERLFHRLGAGYTDASIYARLGVHAMDLAYVHDSYVYHTPADNVDAASSEGLQHEGTNILSIIRGVAEDPGFPKPLTRRQSPVVGRWSNELHYDPSMDSGTFYVSMFDASLWTLPSGVASGLFFATAILSPLAAFGILMCFWESTRHSSAPNLVQALRLSGVEAVCCLAYVALGVASGALFDVVVISWRDVRIWYGYQGLRLLFLSLSGALPGILLELLRRWGEAPMLLRCCWPLVQNSAFGTDTTALLGALTATAVLLLASSLNAHVGFAIFWSVLFAPVGLLAEALILASLPSGGDPGDREASFSLLATHPGKLPLRRDAEEDDTRRMVGAVVRDVFAVLLPLILQMPQLFNLLSVLTYIVDGSGGGDASAGLGVSNGVLLGLSGATLALMFVPVSRRLSFHNSLLAALVVYFAHMVLLALCLFVSADATAYCYFMREC